MQSVHMSGKDLLLDPQDSENYQIDGEEITGGTFSESACRTAFGWNNETLNAWTMLPAPAFATIGLVLARFDAY